MEEGVVGAEWFAGLRKEQKKPQWKLPREGLNFQPLD